MKINPGSSFLSPLKMKRCEVSFIKPEVIARCQDTVLIKNMAASSSNQVQIQLLLLFLVKNKSENR